MYACVRVCVRVNGYIRRKRRKKETKEEQNISPFRRLSDYNKSGKKESKKKKFASKIIRFKATLSEHISKYRLRIFYFFPSFSLR